MNVRYNKRDLSEHEIRIITPVDSSFESNALKYFKNKTPQELKPFSVFIENLGTRTIVAYVLTWKLSNQNGQITQSTVGYTEPGILMGDEISKDPRFKHTTAIEPHSVRCFNWNAQIMEDAPSLSTSQQTRDESPLRQMLSSELAKATDITVTLDGAVFDDGTFVGTNLAFFQQMEAMVNAKVDLLREVAEANAQGRVDQVLDSIAAMSSEPDVPSSESSMDAYYRRCKKDFAMEINGMTRAYGKEKMVPHLLKAHRRARPVLRME